jgi:hypothetical protein
MDQPASLELASGMEIVAPEPRDCVLLTGSVALGFSAPGTDLDILYIGTDGRAPTRFGRASDERRPEQEANGFSIHYLRVPGVEIDVEFWPAARVERAIAEFGRGIAAAAEIEEQFTRLAGLERKVGLDLLHALLNGKPHPDTTAAAQALRRLVDWQRFFAWNRDYHLLNVADSVTGARKSLQTGEPEEAYLKLSWGADHLVDALSFHGGRSISRWKWRLRYLAHLEPPVQGWYRKVKFEGLPDTAELRRWIAWLDNYATLIGAPPAVDVGGL